MPVSPARAAAFEILLRIETTDAYASELLHSAKFARLSPADHGLLTELALGVMRWRSVLDRRIAQHVTKPFAKLDLEVLTALRLGAYQLLFLDRVPRHAAVNESVELVKQARKRSAAGMVNAILRKIASEASDQPQPSKSLKRGAPAVTVHDKLAAHPEWLIDRWAKVYGAQVAQKICAYDQAQPKTTIRVADAGLRDELQTDGIELKSGTLLSSAFIVEASDITQTKAFRERRLTIQDEASQLVALLVGTGKTILDCCAAPGGKTRILAEQNPQSMIVAMEVHPRRAALLKRLVPENNVRIIAADARQIPLSMEFDRVLVDAPCTGSGTLARNPEIKWRLKPEDISRLHAYQTGILLSAMRHVAAGGRLIYSTCSLEPEENERAIESVVARNSSFRVVECSSELRRLKRDGEFIVENSESVLSGPYLRTIPGVHSSDGFFAAILEKK